MKNICYILPFGLSKTKKNEPFYSLIENVVSKLLPDGMIRYSTGIFQSVEAAIPMKNAAIEKGITDAFVTAYYKGERITLSEAKRLLQENGNGILEKP